MTHGHLNRVYVIIDFYIFETFMQIKLKQKSENIRKMKQLQMMRKIIYNKLANRQDPEHRMQPAHPASSEAAKMTAR